MDVSIPTEILLGIIILGLGYKFLSWYYKKYILCPQCKGSGKGKIGRTICPSCNGKGKY